MPKQRINLLVDDDVWVAFRQLCVSNRTSASQEIERLMRRRLAEAEEAKRPTSASDTSER